MIGIRPQRPESASSDRAVTAHVLLREEPDDEDEDEDEPDKDDKDNDENEADEEDDETGYSVCLSSLREICS